MEASITSQGVGPERHAHVASKSPTAPSMSHMKSTFWPASAAKSDEEQNN